MIVRSLKSRALMGSAMAVVLFAAPGVVLTARNRPVLSDPVYAERVMAQAPLRSFGEPEDIAGAVLLLCSRAGRYITGASIPVDGGMPL